MKTKTPKYYWHIHHEILVESLTEPLKNRIKYIKEEKPEDEIELRLRLIKPVKGKLPGEFVKASQTWVKAYQASVKAYQASDKAYQAWDKAYQAWGKASQARAKADQVWDKAEQARVKASQAWDKANQARVKAYQAWDKAYQDNLPALEKLHKVECGCGWSSERSTIFTKVNGLEK